MTFVQVRYDKISFADTEYMNLLRVVSMVTEPRLLYSEKVHLGRNSQSSYGHLSINFSLMETQ